MVVRVEGNALISMCWFAIHCGGQTVAILGHKNIQEGYPALLSFHREVDVWRLLIEVLMEPGQFFTMLPDDKSVIHIASPNSLLDGLLFKFHEPICNDGGQRGTHCCTIGLLVELALALEIGGVEA